MPRAVILVGKIVFGILACLALLASAAATLAWLEAGIPFEQAVWGMLFGPIGIAIVLFLLMYRA